MARSTHPAKRPANAPFSQESRPSRMGRQPPNAAQNPELPLSARKQTNYCREYRAANRQKTANIAVTQASPVWAPKGHFFNLLSGRFNTAYSTDAH